MALTISYPGASHTLGTSPQQVSFGYQLNTSAQDTAAGRVIQVLSASVTALTVRGQIGASKGYVEEDFTRYMALVRFVKNLMLWQAASQAPAHITIAPAGYDLDVFLKSVSLDDQLAQSAYRYSLEMSVDQDANGVATTSAMADVFSHIKSQVGFTAGKAGFHGGDGEEPAVMSTGADKKAAQLKNGSSASNMAFAFSHLTGTSMAPEVLKRVG